MQLGKKPRLLASCCLPGILLSTCPTLSAHCPHAACLQEGSDLVPERLKWDSQLSLSPEPDWQYTVPQGCCGRVTEERGSLCPPCSHCFVCSQITLYAGHTWGGAWAPEGAKEQAWP